MALRAPLHISECGGCPCANQRLAPATPECTWRMAAAQCDTHVSELQPNVPKRQSDGFPVAELRPMCF